MFNCNVVWFLVILECLIIVKTTKFIVQDSKFIIQFISLANVRYFLTVYYNIPTLILYICEEYV